MPVATPQSWANWDGWSPCLSVVSQCSVEVLQGNWEMQDARGRLPARLPTFQRFKSALAVLRVEVCYAIGTGDFRNKGWS